MMKRIISAFLAAILLLAPIAALPIFSVTNDGTNEALEKIGYVGITTEEELKTETRNFYLKNDIVFTDGIGVNRSNISINGNGHTVYFAGGISIMNNGRNINVSNLALAGNVIITEGSLDANSSSYSPLAISGAGNFSLSNVHSTVNITVIDDKFSGTVGGIISKMENAFFTDASYSGIISTGRGGSDRDIAPAVVGGIAGEVRGVFSARNVRANAKIMVDNKGILAVGGILGMLLNTSLSGHTVHYCDFSGSITVRGETNSECGIGGIIGYVARDKNLDITATVNDGDIKLENAENTASLGGILGLVKNCKTLTVKHIINNGDLSGGHIAGGVLGSALNGDARSDIKLANAKNVGTVEATDAAGGIIGYLDSNCYATVDSVFNSGAVSVTAESANGAAGIVGAMKDPLKEKASLTHTYNTGDIAGANSTPIIRAEGYNDTEFNFYSNDVEGEHVGVKEELENIMDKVNVISFISVDTTALRNEIADISEYSSLDYTTPTWNKLQTAVQNALAVLEAPTKQWEVDEALANVLSAKEQLELTQTTKIELEKIDEYLAECKELRQSDYTTASWSKFYNALTKLDRNEITPHAKRAAYEELRKARDELVYIKDLRDALAKLSKNEKDYPTSAAWMAAMAAISQANSILSSASVTQEQVDAATEAIKNAIESMSNKETTGPDSSDTETFTGITDTDIPKSDFENIRDAWLEYLAMQGMTPPETEDSNDIFSPENDEELQAAWRAFLAQQLANSGSGNSGSGGTDKNNKNYGATIGIAAAAVTLILAIGVGLSLRRKDD